MKVEERSLRIAATILATAAVAVGGFKGGDDGERRDLESSYTVAQVKEVFAAETGEQLTLSESDFGGPPLLTFEEDGDPYSLSDKEEKFVREFGAFAVYVVEQGDTQQELGLIIGETGQDPPSDVGGDTVTYSYEVAAEPDSDGITWKETCNAYEVEESLNSCCWTGYRQYGSNVVVSW